jgi:predicted  nucleic acid-binding Zn-ribbon protein
MKRSSLSRREHDRIIADLKRRHDAETANLRADVARLRAERDQFAKDRDAVTATARRDAAEAHATIARLKEDLDAASQGGDHIPALRRRIKHLEKQLDDATHFGDIGVPAAEDWRRRPEAAS